MHYRRFKVDKRLIFTGNDLELPKFVTNFIRKLEIIFIYIYMMHKCNNSTTGLEDGVYTI